MSRKSTSSVKKKPRYIFLRKSQLNICIGFKINVDRLLLNQTKFVVRYRSEIWGEVKRMESTKQANPTPNSAAIFQSFK